MRGKGDSFPDQRTALPLRALSHYMSTERQLFLKERRGDGDYFHKVELITLHVNNRDLRDTRTVSYHKKSPWTYKKSAPPPKKNGFRKGAGRSLLLCNLTRAVAQVSRAWHR